MLAVIPIDDTVTHKDFDTKCDCNPKLTTTDSGELLLIHNSFDGREQFEIDNPIRQN